MQLDIHPEKKLVCIWLTKAESADTSAQEQLGPLYDRFRKQKFLVAVFRSGGQDLTDLTSELLQKTLSRWQRLFPLAIFRKL